MNRHSPDWLALKGAINDRLEQLRDALETPGLPPEGFRGEIAGLRWVVSVVEPTAPITEPTGTDYNARPVSAENY